MPNARPEHDNLLEKFPALRAHQDSPPTAAEASWAAITRAVRSPWAMQLANPALWVPKTSSALGHPPFHALPLPWDGRRSWVYALST